MVRPGGELVVSVGLCALVCYLAAHSITGRQGLLSYVRLQEEERALEAESARLHAARETLKREISTLAPDSLDLDVLETRAYQLLAAADPEAIVVALPYDGNAKLP